MPSAFSAGSPPLEERMARAISAAIAGIWRIQIDVVGNQEFPRTDGNRASSGMQRRSADVRRACRIERRIAAQGFELAFADLLQGSAFRTQRGGFVEIDGHLGSAPRFRWPTWWASAAQSCMRDAFDGHEWQHVGGADARVRALMLRQIDQAGRRADAAQGGFGDGFGRACQGDHGAIVVGVAVAIEHPGFAARRSWPPPARRCALHRGLRRNWARIRSVVAWRLWRTARSAGRVCERAPCALGNRPRACSTTIVRDLHGLGHPERPRTCA